MWASVSKQRISFLITIYYFVNENSLAVVALNCAYFSSKAFILYLCPEVLQISFAICFVLELLRFFRFASTFFRFWFCIVAHLILNWRFWWREKVRGGIKRVRWKSRDAINSTYSNRSNSIKIPESVSPCADAQWYDHMKNVLKSGRQLFWISHLVGLTHTLSFSFSLSFSFHLFVVYATKRENNLTIFAQLRHNSDAR